MNPSESSRKHLLSTVRAPRLAAVAAGLATVALVTAGCTAVGQSATAAGSESAFFNADAVHTVSVEFDEDDYQAMIDAYAETGDKDWISATVTIDGETFENVGLRLKGNSSLRGIGTQSGDATEDDESTTDDTAAADDAETADDDTATNEPTFDEGDGEGSADDPASLPWLIRLDKYVDGQQYAGRSDFVVRGNNTESSLNEAVALHVIDEAGVAAEDAAYVRLSVNGGDERLRLVLDLPDDDAWNEDEFGGTGITYKADASGDYSYRGEDASEYVDVFDVKYDADELSEEEEYAPLIEFLDFINNSSDEEFAEQLSDYLDVDSFADYLAVQDLVANTDDIDGPGNNSYLHYDPDTGLMTVVAWDQNLSYGGFGGGGGFAPGGGGMGQRGGAEMPDGTEMPEGMDFPEGMERPDGMPQGGQGDGTETDSDGETTRGPGMGQGGGMMGGDNTLVTRFLENDDFTQLYDDSLAELTESIYDSGDAQDYLDDLVALLSDQASDLIDADTLQSEADAISQTLSGDAATPGAPTGGAPDAEATETPDADES
jgi:spore coat protein CotH